jgi:undecaprenyl-diphosphatase
MNFVHSFDVTAMRWAQNLPAPLAWLMPVATFVGLPGIMAAVGIVVAALLWIRGIQPTAQAFVVASASLLIPTIIKQFVGRVRPDTLYAAGIHSSSFPSGHAFDAVVILGLIAYLAWQFRYGPGIALGLILLAFLIGLSRIYLGAHYPSDVLGGWVLGGLTLAAIIYCFNL